MSITTDTRWKSFEKIQDSDLPEMIIEVLKQARAKGISGMTAREIAVVLKNQGLVRVAERQTTAPRITELIDAGKVKAVGKVRDESTNRNVATFMLTDEHDKEAA